MLLRHGPHRVNLDADLDPWRQRAPLQAKEIINMFHYFRKVRAYLCRQQAQPALSHMRRRGWSRYTVW